jgi:hypothetical protein
VVQYATAVELAGYMQQDVDTYTANLVLTTSSQMFSTAAETWFAPTTATYQFVADGCRTVRLPFSPITAISAVRIAGVTVSASDYTLVRDVLYRKTSTFGTPCKFPPDLGEVDLTHGFATPGDDVKGAVLETAAAAYSVPVAAVLGESIDDYQVKYSAAGGGVQLTASALSLAQSYRGVFAA